MKTSMVPAPEKSQTTERITGPANGPPDSAVEVPIPYPKHLEDASIPQVPGIVAAAKAQLGR